MDFLLLKYLHPFRSCRKNWRTTKNTKIFKKISGKNATDTESWGPSKFPVRSKAWKCPAWEKFLSSLIPFWIVKRLNKTWRVVSLPTAWWSPPTSIRTGITVEIFKRESDRVTSVLEMMWSFDNIEQSMPVSETNVMHKWWNF